MMKSEQNYVKNRSKRQRVNSNSGSNSMLCHQTS